MAVDEPELFEMPQCVLEILAARAATPGGAQDQPRHPVERKVAGVVWAVPQSGEGEGAQRPAPGAHLQEPRRVDRSPAHLTLPDPVESVCRQLQRSASARPTAVEPK